MTEQIKAISSIILSELENVIQIKIVYLAEVELKDGNLNGQPWLLDIDPCYYIEEDF